jgi:hypothetical protein
LFSTAGPIFVFDFLFKALRKISHNLKCLWAEPLPKDKKTKVAIQETLRLFLLSLQSRVFASASVVPSLPLFLSFTTVSLATATTLALNSPL